MDFKTFFCLKHFLISYFIFISLLAYNQDSTYMKYYYPDGVLSSEGTLLNNKPEGIWKNYYPNTVLKSIGKRTNFELDSVWNFYDESGLLTNRVSYFNGMKNGYNEIYEIIMVQGKPHSVLKTKELYLENVKNGKTLEYDYNGNLVKEIPYIKGKMQGVGFEYNTDGVVIGVMTYQDNKLLKYERINRVDKTGKKEGIWKEFHSNGMVKIETNYLNGELHGISKTFNHQGQVEKVYKFQNNKQIEEEIVLEFEEPEEVIEYYENNSIKSRGLFKNNIPYGIHRFYTSDNQLKLAKIFSNEGILLSEGILFDNGVKHGNWINYYPHGIKESVGNYINNKKEGKWIFFYESGKLKQEGIFLHDKYSGLWIWYYENGSVLKKEEMSFNKREGVSLEYDIQGNTVAEGMYVEDLKDGRWFELVGDNIEKGIYKLGEKHDVWKQYYTSGELRFEGAFSLGKPKGKHTYYYQDGKIEHVEIYKNGKKNKNWIYYKPDGSVKLIVFYKNDKEIKIMSF